MKRLLIAALLLSGAAKAQDRTEVWLGAGIKHEVVKDLSLGFQTNMRVRTSGELQTLFQELSVKSEHLKWLRPSVDYRLITDYDKAGNYSIAHRFNVNADFRRKVKDLKYGVRLRYQLVIGTGRGSGSDLDPAMRVKPYISWGIPKTRLTPEFTAELFYNPVYGDFGRHFNRVRFGFGTTIDLPGKNELGITYYYGKKFYAARPYDEHLFSLEYGYEWKKSKKKKQKTSPGLRNL